LTPEELSGAVVREEFHSMFAERFSPSTPLQETDDRDSWGSGWSVPGSTINLEG